MKVLLAEDSRTNQALISAYIKEAGHEVVIAENGRRAIEEFSRSQPDLVIMDIVMPELDGIEAAVEIRKICESEDNWIPIIFLSAMSESEDIVKGIDAGGDDYLTKPIDAVVLNAKLRAMGRIADMRHQLKRMNRELRLITLKDGLTGISNRRYFDESLLKEAKRSVRSKTPLSLALCDIDHFKQYNDNYGHQAGDDCLKSVAQAMSNATKRPGDIVARYGGEEFGIILPETSQEGAASLVESIRYTVDELNLKHEYSSVADNVTISIGVATIQAESIDGVETIPAQLISTADKALYSAKEQGRNRVVIG